MNRINAGQAKLANALKRLLENWEIVGETWKDKVRTEFEEKHLRELTDRVRSVLSAMDRLGEALGRAEQDCQGADRERLL